MANPSPVYGAGALRALMAPLPFEHPNTTFVTAAPSDPFAPESWADFKGQPELKRELEVRIKSSRLRKEPLDHVLLLSGPGMGKTSIANLIAKELGVQLTNCPTPISEGPLIELIRKMGPHDVLFLDEVHQIAQARGQVEVLLPILVSRQTRHGEKLPAITIVAATTESHKLPQPFIDRFPVKPRFIEYTIAEMREIVMEKAMSIELTLTIADAHNLAKACDGVPRIASNFVKAARDLAVVNEVTPTWEEVLKFTGIRSDGLTRDHEEYLHVLYKFYAKRTSSGLVFQSGVMNIAKSLGINKEAVERLEKALIKKGLVELAGSGRRLTSLGIEQAKRLKV